MRHPSKSVSVPPTPFNDGDDSEMLLEVKTISLGKFFPFYVTLNEVLCSEDLPNKYHLFQVFDFGREPRLYFLPRSRRERYQLGPVLYRAMT